MAIQKNIKVKIQGGLGNQLFQYSFALFLKEKFNIDIYLDISWYSKQFTRCFQLNHILDFNIFKQVESDCSFLEKIFNYKSENLITFLLKKGFLPLISYYNGYWQDLFFSKSLRNINFFKKKILFKSFSSDYYVVHLRRGDFNVSKIHFMLSNDHYLKYINLFSDKKIFILSDDKKSALEFKKNINAESEYLDCTDLEAFNIIYNASGGMASNSTFCWWPIYLSDCRNWLMPYNWLKKKNIINHNLAIKNTIII